MSAAFLGAIELGLLYGILAMGVYLSFRVLDFPDLTVDGSFVTGAAVMSALFLHGISPWIATLTALLGGAVAGALTGLLTTKGHIQGLLSGILVQIGLYSINLRIMGRSNVPLLTGTVMDPIAALPFGLHASTLLSFVLLAALCGAILWAFLGTAFGLVVRATGDSPQMVRALGGHTTATVVVGLAISNAFVAFSGALVAQFQGFTDVTMGIGMIVVGLAAVIIGEVLFGAPNVWRGLAAAVGGAIVFRLVIALALRAGLAPTDLKLATAVIVVVALLLPRWLTQHRQRQNLQQAVDAALQEKTDAQAG